MSGGKATEGQKSERSGLCSNSTHLLLSLTENGVGTEGQGGPQWKGQGGPQWKQRALGGGSSIVFRLDHSGTEVKANYQGGPGEGQWGVFCIERIIRVKWRFKVDRHLRK